MSGLRFGLRGPDLEADAVGAFAVDFATSVEATFTVDSEAVDRVRDQVLAAFSAGVADIADRGIRRPSRRLTMAGVAAGASLMAIAAVVNQSDVGGFLYPTRLGIESAVAPSADQPEGWAVRMHRLQERMHDGIVSARDGQVAAVGMALTEYRTELARLRAAVAADPTRREALVDAVAADLGLVEHSSGPTTPRGGRAAHRRHACVDRFGCAAGRVSPGGEPGAGGAPGLVRTDPGVGARRRTATPAATATRMPREQQRRRQRQRECRCEQQYQRQRECRCEQQCRRQRQRECRCEQQCRRQRATAMPAATATRMPLRTAMRRQREQQRVEREQQRRRQREQQRRRQREQQRRRQREQQRRRSGNGNANGNGVGKAGSAAGPPRRHRPRTRHRSSSPLRPLRVAMRVGTATATGTQAGTATAMARRTRAQALTRPPGVRRGSPGQVAESVEPPSSVTASDPTRTPVAVGSRTIDRPMLPTSRATAETR